MSSVHETSLCLQGLHGIFMIHGDVKAANFCFTSSSSKDAELSVVDFGAALRSLLLFEWPSALTLVMISALIKTITCSHISVISPLLYTMPPSSH
jgi:tRNA A-37 threonylcarbamoyl transferase component Bud32